MKLSASELVNNYICPIPFNNKKINNKLENYQDTTIHHRPRIQGPGNLLKLKLKGEDRIVPIRPAIHVILSNRRDEFYANDPCGSQFESQDIFSHLSKNNYICYSVNEMIQKTKCFQNHAIPLCNHMRLNFIHIITRERSKTIFSECTL